MLYFWEEGRDRDMTMLYSHEAAAAWKKKAEQRGCLILVLALAALFVCILLCTKVNTLNVTRMLYTVMIISTLAGWAVMFLWVYAYRPARARSAHMKGILAGEQEMYEGTLRRTGESFAIPGSVVVKKVELRKGEQVTLLHADSALIKLLPPDGTNVQLVTVRKFITGYEVIK